MEGGDDGGVNGVQRSEAMALLRMTLGIQSKLILQNPVRSARHRILREAHACLRADTGS